MSEMIKQLKEKQINDFVYQLDLNSNGLSASEIRKGLRAILSEEPAVKFNYKSEKKINEDTGEIVRTPHVLETIEIVYTYIGDNDEYRSGILKYIVN